MRQVWITRVGPPEVLELREAPDPLPKPGEVQIRVRASGVNFADILARLGLYPDAPRLPLVVGYEVAGGVGAAAPPGPRVPEGGRVVAFTQVGRDATPPVGPARLPFQPPRARRDAA